MNTIALPPRMSQCVDLAAEGKSNKEIAAALGISTGTVKVYLTGAFSRLGVKSRWQLMTRRQEVSRQG